MTVAVTNIKSHISLTLQYTSELNEIEHPILARAWSGAPSSWSSVVVFGRKRQRWARPVGEGFQPAKRFRARQKVIGLVQGRDAPAGDGERPFASHAEVDVPRPTAGRGGNREVVQGATMQARFASRISRPMSQHHALR